MSSSVVSCSLTELLDVYGISGSSAQSQKGNWHLTWLLHTTILEVIKKNPHECPKSIFSICKHYMTRDVCKTVDRTPQTAHGTWWNMVMSLLWYIFDFIFAKDSLGKENLGWENAPEKRYCRETNCKHRSLKCARWAVLTCLNRQHFWVQYPVLKYFHGSDTTLEAWQHGFSDDFLILWVQLPCKNPNTEGLMLCT